MASDTYAEGAHEEDAANEPKGVLELQNEVGSYEEEGGGRSVDARVVCGVLVAAMGHWVCSLVAAADDALEVVDHGKDAAHEEDDHGEEVASDYVDFDDHGANVDSPHCYVHDLHDEDMEPWEALQVAWHHYCFDLALIYLHSLDSL